MMFALSLSAYGADCTTVHHGPNLGLTEIIQEIGNQHGGAQGDTVELAVKAEVEKYFRFNDWVDLKVQSVKEIKHNIYQITATMYGSKTVWKGHVEIFITSLGTAKDGSLNGYAAELQDAHHDYSFRLKSSATHQQIEF